MATSPFRASCACAGVCSTSPTASTTSGPTCAAFRSTAPAWRACSAPVRMPPCSCSGASEMVTLVLDLESSLLDSIPAIAASLCRGIDEACGAATDEASVARMLRGGQLDALRTALGDHAFRAALRRGAVHYQRVGQFMAWPYVGVPAMLTALRAAGVGVALVSRTPRAALERIIERWGLELGVALFDCPTLPAPAQDR